MLFVVVLIYSLLVMNLFELLRDRVRGFDIGGALKSTL